MSEPIHQSNPAALPDDAFAPGRLSHLVVGNAARMLDARRTPMRITNLHPETGTFEVEVLAFEDAGVRWRLDVEDVVDFQFAAGAREATPDVHVALQAAAARFNQSITLSLQSDRTSDTERRLLAERACVREWLGTRPRARNLDTTSRARDPIACIDLTAYLDARGLLDIERGFAQGFVSNPHSGEVIKGHAVVLAHLGLAAYVGKVVRDVGIFDPPWTRERRAAHIICRLAFMREYFARADVHEVVLYRGLATDGRLRAHSDTSFVSATFAREVAESIVSGGPTTRTAVLYRQVVSTERLFMTHLETAAMSRHYRESEAVLLADPGNLAF